MSENSFDALYLKQKRNIKREQHSFLMISAMFFCFAIIIVFLSNIAVEPRPLGRGYKALIFSLHDHWS